MKSRFAKYLSKDGWRIYERGWSPRNLGVRESLFTLGNGYLGLRGIYEEIPDGTEPGTYIAGVYDGAASMAPELVNAPNPIDFRIIVEGEKLDIGRMKILENERILDLRKGFLLRRTVFLDTMKRRFLYESLRFFSMSDAHLGGMRVSLKSLDKPAKIIVQDTIDDSITNIGSTLEGRKRHTQLVEVSQDGDLNYLAVKTFTRKIWIAYASFLAVQRGDGESVGTLNKIFNMTVKKNETVCFTKIFSVHTSKHISHANLKKMVLKEMGWAKKSGFDDLFKRHMDAWEGKWRDAGVEIEGDKETEHTLRLNIYHLLSSGKAGDSDVSIGPRALSGDSYQGHIFWDTEIFILPFFIYTNPDIAKNLLMYRFHRLNEARKIAKAKGFRGALFPRESANAGDDVTLPYAKKADGTIIEIRPDNTEHHIVSDIAYGVSHYFAATGDEEFMLKAGLEILFETARFWASSVKYSNVYTNEMAGWNLYKAKELYDYFIKAYPRAVKRLADKISLGNKEIKRWAALGNKIKIPFSRAKGITEEFDRYAGKTEMENKKRAYRYFIYSLYIDLKNLRGNTKGGIHAALIGGTWQAVIMGFCGFRIMDDMPSFEPALPRRWRSVKFSLKWKGYNLKLSVSNKKIKIFTFSRKKDYILVKAFNSVYKVPFNKEYTICNLVRFGRLSQPAKSNQVTKTS